MKPMCYIRPLVIAVLAILAYRAWPTFEPHERPQQASELTPVQRGILKLISEKVRDGQTKAEAENLTQAGGG